MQTQDQFGGLEAVRGQFEATEREARALAGSLSEEEFNWPPAPGSWSIGQCLQHLANGTDEVLPALDLAIRMANERQWMAQGPVRYGLFARMMVKSMEPPVKWRMKTNRIFEPARETLRRDAVLAELTASRERILQRVRQSVGLDLKRAIVVSPVSRLIRVPLGAYLAFLAAHDRRHLWQARQVREASGFGRAATFAH
ncbi:MAG TPA: DinB family protein [Gemmatimonadales bacterium]|nr:DinB family protein [Gemmatimonadales bacterium]